MINTLKALIRFIDKNFVFLIGAFVFFGGAYCLYVTFVEFYFEEVLNQMISRAEEIDRLESLSEFHRNLVWWWGKISDLSAFLYLPCEACCLGSYTLGGLVLSVALATVFKTYPWSDTVWEFIWTGKIPNKLPGDESVPAAIVQLDPNFQPDLNQIILDFMVTYQDGIITWCLLFVLLLAAFLCRDENYTFKSCLLKN